jgi:hypothetical protein
MMHVEAAMPDGGADPAGDVVESGVVDRTAGRRAGGDRQDDFRALARGEIEIGAEP